MSLPSLWRAKSKPGKDTGVGLPEPARSLVISDSLRNRGRRRSFFGSGRFRKGSVLSAPLRRRKRQKERRLESLRSSDPRDAHSYPQGDQMGVGTSAAQYGDTIRMVSAVYVEQSRAQSVSFQVGMRSMGRRRMAFVAIGPARLGGSRNEAGGSLFGHMVDDRAEVGAAASAEATIHAGWIGIGLGLFAAGAAHHSLTGATVCLQLGNLGE